MKTIFDRIENLVKELKSFGSLSSEIQAKIDKKFRLEFNYNTNHIEGNTLTYSETELLLMFDDTKGGHSLREYEEMKAHDVAFKMIMELAYESERSLTEYFIRDLNKTILVRPFYKDAVTPGGQNTRRQIEPGDYKKFPNSVLLANGEIFEYASPLETPQKMKELLEWYHNDIKDMHPLEIAALLHYRFVRIHPFDDGNGRISRLLMNYILISNELPAVIIKSADKANYLRALHLADIGDTKAFIEYIGEQLEFSLSIYIKAAKGESIEEAGDLDKQISLLKQKLDGKGDKIQRKKSEQVQKEIKKIVVDDTIQSIYQKVSKITSLFADVEYGFSINNHGRSYKSINKLQSDLDVEWNKEDINIYDFQFRVTLNALLSMGVKIFNVSDYLILKMEDYKYTLSIGNNYLIELLYHHKFSATEIDGLSTVFINKILDSIERNIDVAEKQ